MCNMEQTFKCAIPEATGKKSERSAIKTDMVWQSTNASLTRFVGCLEGLNSSWRVSLVVKCFGRAIFRKILGHYSVSLFEKWDP